MDGNDEDPSCHTPKFDETACEKMTSDEVRKKFPRFFGKCEKCGYEGIAYASMMHYLMGDW